MAGPGWRSTSRRDPPSPDSPASSLVPSYQEPPFTFPPIVTGVLRTPILSRGGRSSRVEVRRSRSPRVYRHGCDAARSGPSGAHADDAGRRPARRTVRLAHDPPACQSQAACRGSGTASYFPARGELASPAKAICSGCAVASDCLDYALSTPDVVPGIWGGTSQSGSGGKCEQRALGRRRGRRRLTGGAGHRHHERGHPMDRCRGCRWGDPWCRRFPHW